MTGPHAKAAGLTWRTNQGLAPTYLGTWRCAGTACRCTHPGMLGSSCAGQQCCRLCAGSGETGTCSTAQHGTAQHGTARHSTARHGMAQHSAAQHGTAQHGTAQHSTPLSGWCAKCHQGCIGRHYGHHKPATLLLYWFYCWINPPLAAAPILPHGRRCTI